MLFRAIFDRTSNLMIFRQLVLHNFGPYVGKQTIDLTPGTEGETRPIILFGGMNGGGKTTLMDAIRLALYGQRAQCSTRGNLSYSDFLSQCVNRHTPLGERTQIELVFQHIEDDRLIDLQIIRHWTKSPKDGKDTLGIFEEDYWKNDYLTNTWDEYIENLLPLGISNLFLFDGEQVKELAEQEIPPPAVVGSIKFLLGLELAERLAVDLDILVRRKRKKWANAKELADLDEMEVKMNQYREELDAAKQDLSSLKNALDRAETAQREAYFKYISEGGKIAAERTTLEHEKRRLEGKIERSRQLLVELSSSSLPLALIEPLLHQMEEQSDRETKQYQAKNAQDLVKQRGDRLLQYIEEIKVNSKQLAKIKAFLEEEDRQLHEAIGSDEDIWLHLDEETRDRLSILLQKELPDFVNFGDETLKTLYQVELDLDNKEREIAAAPSPEIYEQLQQAVNETQADLVKATANYERGQRRCNEAEAKIEALKKDLADYANTALEREQDEHLIRASAKVQHTLKLFKERLTLKKLNKLEIEITECFRYLLHKSDLVHRVAIATDSFALSLYDNQGQPVPKHRLSAGEKQLLAIAFLWGLARVSGRQLPVAIDTPLGRLDSSHRHNLIERYFPSASHQVLLLSTDTEIGKKEVSLLREQGSIAREYLLKYDPKKRQTTVKEGYFWNED